MLTPQRKSDTATATLGIGAALVAITCCAGLPAIGALLGGLTLGAVLGLGLGVALIVGALAWTTASILARRHRRARCDEGSDER